MNNFSISQVGDLTIVALPSDLWVRREWHDELVPAIEPHREAISEQRLVLDFSNVEHVTSKTVYCLLLVRAHFLGEFESTPVHLSVPSATSRRVFEILRLPTHLVTIHNSIEEAIEKLQP